MKIILHTCSFQNTSGVAALQAPRCSCLFFWQEGTMVLLHYAYLQMRDAESCHA